MKTVRKIKHSASCQCNSPLWSDVPLLWADMNAFHICSGNSRCELTTCWENVKQTHLENRGENDSAEPFSHHLKLHNDAEFNQICKTNKSPGVCALRGAFHPKHLKSKGADLLNKLFGADHMVRMPEENTSVCVSSF